ncbi:hypothetical protein A134_23230 [Vibrio crassostreae 9CS106]|uniref:Uncharacterized protein n=1 Tax=Vibrio crassostreae 9CS106 TaxID=1191300 RepID=A0A1B1C3E3_9VIBR|nr:hypothetical protein A134_23230 [Vibrio crassostreae 9CS106]
MSLFSHNKTDIFSLTTKEKKVMTAVIVLPILFYATIYRLGVIHKVAEIMSVYRLEKLMNRNVIEVTVVGLGF